jgi:hypothetical protein
MFDEDDDVTPSDNKEKDLRSKNVNIDDDNDEASYVSITSEMIDPTSQDSLDVNEIISTSV